MRNPIVVVKFGGAAMDDGKLAEAFARDVAHLGERGYEIAVVHGGGPALTRMLARLGLDSEFVDGHRVTSAEAAEVAEMVLSGRLNKEVVASLIAQGVRAVGLSGTDGSLLRIEPHRPGGRDIGHVGLVSSVDTALLHLLLENGYVPVVSSTATGPDGRPWNVNADVVAGAVAAALGADQLVYLSDVPGVIAAGRLQAALDPAGATRLLETGEASGGMRPKLESALWALAQGVREVHLADGRVAGAALSAVLGEPGPRTTIAGSPALSRPAEARSELM